MVYHQKKSSNKSSSSKPILIGQTSKRFLTIFLSFYNIDETGVTAIQDPQKIVDDKGKKQIGARTSSERGTLVNVCVFPLENPYHQYFLCHESSTAVIF